MTPELMALTLAALLQVLQFCAYSIASISQVGVYKAAGPRDKPIELTGVAGRLQRAMNNHFEGTDPFHNRRGRRHLYGPIQRHHDALLIRLPWRA